MLIQQIADKQLVYVRDYKTEYKDVAEEFGMLDETGAFNKYVRISEENYINKNGIAMPAFHIVGKTVNVYVVNDRVEAESNDAEGIAKALNYFPPDSRFNVGDHVFVSKFSTKTGILKDSVQRGISVKSGYKKDLSKIYDLMMHLDLNNGKLFEPVIARYVYTDREMPSRMRLVGYFDLEKYLRVLRDPKADYFHHQSGDLLAYFEMGDKKFAATVVKVARECCILEISGPKGIYDLDKMKEFHPLVVLSKSPLKIKEARFPWFKVKFDHTDVFMTPLMSKMDAWKSLQGALDLLSLPEKKK